MSELLKWSAHLRENFDKVLLVVLFFASAMFTLHLSHHSMDEALIAWSRETSGTILGGLLGLITGARLAASKIPPAADAGKVPDDPKVNA